MLFTHANLMTLSEIVADAARVEILPRFRNLASGDIRQKLSATDLVTEADEAAERLICAKLAKAFPGAVLVGEEGVSANPALLGQLKGADLAFVIDPIDGTLNFASDLTLFASMAAVIVRGEIVGAVIHDPVVNDHAMALAGEGAWMQRPGGKHQDLHVARPVPLGEMTGMASWRFYDEPMRSHLATRFPHMGDVSTLRCCGHEFRLAAAGHCHYLFYGKLTPWDHSPGTLIHREAGGYSAMLDGTPFHPETTKTGMLYAPDKSSWLTLRDALAVS